MWKTVRMDRDKAISLLREAEPLMRKYGVERARLFGSVARGDNRPGSDVDVAVRLKEGTPMDSDTVLGLYGLLTDIFGYVDIVFEPSSRADLQDEIEREHVLAFQ